MTADHTDMSVNTRRSVLAVSATGPDGPSLRVRVLAHVPELARLNVTVDSAPLFTRAEAHIFETGTPIARARTALSARRSLLRRLGDSGHDVTLLSRQADMLPSTRLERAAASGRPIVYDVDDAIWLDSSAGARGHRLALLKNSRRKASWLAQRATAVIAGNDDLATWLARYSDHVHVIPSVIETRGVPVRTHVDAQELTVGWIGSPSTARYLRAIAAPLTAAARALAPKQLRLVVVGGPPIAIVGVTTEAVPWSPEAEADALGRMDVGVMPLPNDAWTRGKCAYKAIQYMASGVPVVADDVGVTASVLGGVAGCAVSSEPGWTDALTQLLADSEARASIGADARARAQSDYSVAGWAPQLGGVLRGAA